MIIDHAGAVFMLSIGFRIIGRIAFPLFVYLIAEGCRHTKSMNKYMFRLGIFALISEIPFDLAFNDGNIDFFQNTNIFYTLWLGVVCVFIFKILKDIDKTALWILSLIPVTLAMFVAEWISSDYGGIGVLFIFLTAVLSKHKPIQLGVMALFCYWIYMDAPLFMLIASLLAVPIIACANGKQGRPVKWLFYYIYPIHLLLFVIIALIFV